MQGTPSSHIENLGLHGPHYAQKIAERGLSDLSHLADSPPSIGKSESDSCADSADVKAQQFVGADRAPMSDSDKRAAIDRAARAVERAFLAWHLENDFLAAADYTKARKVWGDMLMLWGHIE